MVTQVDLTETEIAELQKATNQSDPAGAIRAAMHAFLRQVRRDQLKALSGKVEMLENWQELEQRELDASSGS